MKLDQQIDSSTFYADRPMDGNMVIIKQVVNSTLCWQQ